jgi:uncharacterized OB-fold protein
MLMQGSTCTCGKKVALNRKICPNCGNLMIPIELGDNAVVLTHTTLYTVPEGFNSPIFLVLVELEQGTKLLCESKNEKDLEIGKKGKIVFKNEKYYFVGSNK